MFSEDDEVFKRLVKSCVFGEDPGGQKIVLVFKEVMKLVCLDITRQDSKAECLPKGKTSQVWKMRTFLFETIVPRQKRTPCTILLISECHIYNIIKESKELVNWRLGGNSKEELSSPMKKFCRSRQFFLFLTLFIN